ncbi:hypothetical protein SAY87_031433 [Trapa incisa]|uniref:Uncharacterized protein n=1 Tax=Trapa incisa TaxID=236973 RepID=A0AAN7KX48_9MYRT|nr:hypothetical protein SAY87_031433 [Trapa incisa]
MVEDGLDNSSRPPHGLLLLFVIGIMLMLPEAIIGDGGETVTEAISGLLSSVVLLLVPLILVFTIRLLSSNWSSLAFNMLAGGERLVPHVTAAGALIRTPLFPVLVLVLVMLYRKVSLFSGGD